VTGAVPRALRVLVCASLLCAGAASAAVAGVHKAGTGKLMTLVSDETGTRTVEVFDFRFVFFTTRYRETHAPRSESPTGERIEVINDRKECACLRLADYTKVKFMQQREIAVTYPEGSHVAQVRVTRRNGKVHEFPATDLYGGTGLATPLFSATLDGQLREFPLILPEGADWRGERPVRVILYRSQPPPPSSSKHSQAKPSPP
jgi:hypothetical protein